MRIFSFLKEFEPSRTQDEQRLDALLRPILITLWSVAVISVLHVFAYIQFWLGL